MLLEACCAHLEPIFDGLGEDAILVAYSITVGRQAEGGHGVKETSWEGGGVRGGEGGRVGGRGEAQTIIIITLWVRTRMS